MDFHSAFDDIDTDGSGEISRSELEEYMRKKNYTETFVQKWLNLFDIDGDGSITYDEYCKTLGLQQRKKPDEKQEEETQQDVEHTTKKSTQSKSKKAPAKKTPVTTPVTPVTTDATVTITIRKRHRILVSKRATSVTHGNPEIAPGIRKLSRRAVFNKKALYRYVKKEGEGKSAEKEAAKGETDAADKSKKGRSPRVFETQRAKQKKALRRVKCFQDHKRRLRANISPGTVLILLQGQHKGKRVVFLKQLPDSGLLLVTGPFKYNGVPLRRVHQKLVIATKTKLNIREVKLPERVNDEYFKRQASKQKDAKKKGKAGASADVFAKTEESYKLAAERKEDQKTVDSQVLQCIKAHEGAAFLPGYLGATFGLFKHDLPHKMEF